MNLRVEEGEIILADQGDPDLFDDVAAALAHHFDGTWTTRADGLDQRYGDLGVGDVTVTLHLERDAGVTLYPAREDADSEALLREIETFLRGHRR